MRKNSLFKLALAVILLFSACESIVDDLNTDPNNPTDAPITLVLTGTQVANIVVQEGHSIRVVNMWSGYYNGADRQYLDYSLYNVNAGNFNTSWGNVYQGVVSQTSLITERAEETGERLIAGIAKVVKAQAVGTATELWGDVPFSEAINFEITNPAFDSQMSTLYPGLISLLDEAIADLQSGQGATPGSADINYGGDRDSWIAAAYTLKARYLMDMKDYAGAYTAAQQGISSAAGDLVSPHGTTNDGNLNLTYDFIVQSRSGDMDAGVGEDGAGDHVYAADLLDPSQAEYRGNAKTDESARFNYVYLDNGADSYTGRLEPNYLSTADGSDFNGIISRDKDFRTASYAENLLTLAEAGFRTQGFDTGLTHLNEFRAYMSTGGYIDPTYTAAFPFVYEAYEAADFNDGGMANPGGMSADDALLMEIIEERYLTFIGTHLGFNDLRRLQNESIKLPMDVLLTRGSEFPQRIIYGQDELNSNTNAPSPVPGVFDRMEIYQ